MATPKPRRPTDGGAMRLLIPDGTRRRELPCEEEAPAPTAGSGRTVVVGIRRDPAIRELLTWALVKVANAGNRVAALHIVVAAADGLLMGVDERRRAADSLTSVLAVYTTSATSSRATKVVDEGSFSGLQW